MDTVMIVILAMLVTLTEMINTMKKILIGLMCFVGMSLQIKAQNTQLIEGTVSYVSAKSVYVRFDNAKEIMVKDTLMLLINNRWKKALIVETISSKSCMTAVFISDNISIGTKVGYHKKVDISAVESKVNIKQNVPKNDSIPSINPIKVENKPEIRKQTFNGRITMSSNGSMDEAEKDYNRVRTSFSFDINNIKGGRFSFENYLNYTRRLGPAQPTSRFADDFKVYSFSINYDVNDKTRLSFGRKINLRMANMGAIDGLQAEHKIKKVTFGGFVGSRPDDMDYSFNPSLLQFGAFVAHETEIGKGQIQTSFAIAEQQNNAKIDRRFAYFQHSNSISKKINLFYSMELDLFQNVDSVQSNKINLTSAYISLRYKPFKTFSITASYDNRRNVIYYETFRTYIEQLLNQETRQGIRLNVNYNFAKYMNFNASGFYRYQDSRPEPTKNYVASLTFSQIPRLNASLNLNVNTMNTYYFDGNIYGARLNKDLFKSRLSTEINYRMVDYIFFNKEQPSLKQEIVGISANIYGNKRTSFMFSYEGTFEPTKKYNRYYVTLSQRFRNKK